MKKLLAFILAMMLVLSMASIAVAEETTTTYTITINPKDSAEHTYEVYQIFTGDVTTDATGATVLTNVEWGQNKKTNGEEATDVADKLVAGSAKVNAYCDFTSTPIDTIKKVAPATTYVSKGLVPGYYLIKDKDNSLKNQDGAYTLLVVKILSENINVIAKSAKPSVDKQVQDEVADQDKKATGDDGWGESADHALFEEFKFKLVATLTDDAQFDQYDKYTVKFQDTMSKGVTFVQINSVKVANQTVAPENYTCTANAGQKGGSWTLTIGDIKEYATTLAGGTTVEVIYTAYLNEEAEKFNASADKTENENKVYLEYSNNPNAGGENDFGETPKDSVWLFTYTVNNTKYANTAADGNKLAGAGFKLYDSNKNEVKLLVKETNDGNYLVYDGDENKIPAHYQPLTNNEMITATDGVFNIIGLDHGVYTLKETTVPNGYNKMDDQTITITATHQEVDSGASAEMNLSAGSNMNNDIVNKSGATLPETGGIGTTIFYVLGGVMFAGAALMLVVRRKAEADEI